MTLWQNHSNYYHYFLKMNASRRTKKSQEDHSESWGSIQELELCQDNFIPASIFFFFKHLEDWIFYSTISILHVALDSRQWTGTICRRTFQRQFVAKKVTNLLHYDNKWNVIIKWKMNKQLSWKCFEPGILTLERCKNSLKLFSKSFKLIFDVIT